MNELDIEKIKKQHLDNYKKAVLQIIRNNTNSLLDDDIMLLIDKPPLDSMDVIKNKFLSIAKKENIIVDTMQMDKIIDNYRGALARNIEFIKKLRSEQLISDVEKFPFEKENDVIKITKKQLSDINKKINSEVKKIINENIEKYLISKLADIYSTELEDAKKRKILLEVSKYFKNNYQKQFLENINFKILVKDTTLISGVREQAERYLFTKANSRLNDIVEDN